MDLKIKVDIRIKVDLAKKMEVVELIKTKSLVKMVVVMILVVLREKKKVDLRMEEKNLAMRRVVEKIILKNLKNKIN